MARRGWKRDLMKSILRVIFQGRRLVKTEQKNRYLVINYDGDLRHLRMIAQRAKELGWGEVIEDPDGIRFRLLDVGEKAFAEEASGVREGF